MERAFKGVWIPADIWLDKALTLLEKCVLVEIDSLSSDKSRGCYKSNKAFAEFFGLSPNRISEIVSSLEKKGFVRVSFKREGRRIVERNIFMIPVSERVLEISKGGVRDSEGGTRNIEEPIRDSEGGYSENTKESNTTKSNTESNTVRDTYTPPGESEPLARLANSHSDKKPKLPAKYSIEEFKLLDLSTWPELPDDQTLIDWLAIRKTKRAPVTQRAMSDMGDQLANSVRQGWKVTEIFHEILTGNPWAGFKASYLDNTIPPGGAHGKSTQRRGGQPEPFIPDNESTAWLDEAKERQRAWNSFWAGNPDASKHGESGAGPGDGCRADELPVRSVASHFPEIPGSLDEPAGSQCSQGRISDGHAS